MPRVPSTPKVVVVAPQFTDGFMRDDLRILHQFVDVLPQELASTPLLGGNRLGGSRVGRGVRALLHVVQLVYRLLRHDVRVVIFWFATTNMVPLLAAVTRLLGRRVVVITGGSDAVYVPEIDWGEMKRPWHRRTFRWLMRLAASVLPFSESARLEIASRATARRMLTAYPAVDTRFFHPKGPRNDRQVVTCCYRYGGQQIVQKGLDHFVAVARELPELSFVVVGDPADDAARALIAGAPENVRFVPRIPSREGYRDLLSGSSVYMQLSAHEGFGVSLAEAMACGCLPICADRYSMPEVVGDAGWIVPYGDRCATVAAVRAAIAAPCSAREAARGRMVDHFSRQRRSALLRTELARLLPEVASPPVRIELGCGSTGVAGAIGVDARMTPQTSAVCDVRRACFRTGIADEVYSFCVLEHLDDPYELMDEVVRILKPDGRAYLRVPNIGTFSSHLDTTHRFLADLRIWRGIMEGYFESVTVVPEGTKYRDNRLLTSINWLLVHGLRFHELTQGWTFVCDRPRAEPARGYTGWWMEPTGGR